MCEGGSGGTESEGVSRERLRLLRCIIMMCLKASVFVDFFFKLQVSWCIRRLFCHYFSWDIFVTPISPLGSP